MDKQNVLKTGFFWTTCMAIGFMISPLSLMIIGNSAGLAGYRFLWALPLIAMISLRNALLYDRLQGKKDSNGTKEVHKTDGQWVLESLKLGSVVPFVVTASILILAIAGYALNEIFVYWFPNLLFSISLLLFIVYLKIKNPSVAGKIQIFSVLTFIVSMLVLFILGFLGWEKTDFRSGSFSQMPYLDWRAVLMLFWLFMVAELAVCRQSVIQNRWSNAVAIMSAFFVALAIFMIWGRYSIHFVSLERLAETTVPHSVVARAISGENGRKIMGLAILSGSFASVNTLIGALAAVWHSMSKSRNILKFFKIKIFGENAAMLLGAIGILCMMIIGMAGKDITWVAARSALYVWLISHAALNLSAFQQIDHSGVTKKRLSMLAGFITAAIYGMVVVTLVFTDPDFASVIVFMITYIVISGFIRIVCRSHHPSYVIKERN